MTSLRRLLPLLALVLVVTPPAIAQRPAQPADGSTMRLASQTPWVLPGTELVLRLAITTDRPRSEVELAVAVHRRVPNRSEFVQTLEDRVRGTAITTTSTLLDELEPDPAGAYVVRLPLQHPDQPLQRDRLRLREEGVYPVRVELREAGGGDVLARLTTHLLYASPPGEGGSRLGFSWVVPVHAALALRPDGSRRLPPQDLASLETIARALDAHPLLPVVLAPTPETLQALATSDSPAASDTLNALGRAAASRQVIGSTYVATVPTAFNELEGEAASQRERGENVITSTLQVQPDTRTAIVQEHLDEVALQRLREHQVERLVVAEQLLVPVPLDVTLAQPFALETRQLRRAPAVAADPGLGAHFDGPDPVLAAHRLLADLAVLYADRPGRSRAVVAVAPRGWRADRRFLAAALEGLESSPLIEAMSLDRLFENVPPATARRDSPLVRTLEPPAEPPGAPLPADDVREARDRLEGLASMLDADNPIDDSLEELLLAAQASGLRASQRGAYLAGFHRALSAHLGGVRVPAERTVTLTARRGDIPITVQSETGYPVRVRVVVSSDKLTFPQGAARELELTRRNTTAPFAVETRTSGTFPLRVRLLSPDGRLLVGESRFIVRSTAFSGVGVVLSAGAGVFLLGWWARHLAQGRRNRRLVPA